MVDDRTRAANYFETNRQRDRARFVATFNDDAGRAGCALWDAFDAVSPERLFEEPWVIEALAAAPSGASGERALALFRALGQVSPRWLGEPGYGNKVSAYPGWSVALEALTRGLPDRAALARGIELVPGPLGRGLAFCLARLGELEPPADSLAYFARWAALHFTWCPAVFEGAELAFGEEAWRRAVVTAAASPEVGEVGLWASHFAPFVPYADDETLFRAVTKLTWHEEAALAFFEGRGPGMWAVIEREAGVVLTLEGWLDYAADTAIAAYARGLRARGEPLPERFVSFLEAQLRHPSRPKALHDLLRVLDPARREAVLLAWAEEEGHKADDPEELVHFVTPAIAAWAGRALLCHPDSNWLGAQIADFGVSALDALADAEGLEAIEPHAAYGLIDAAHRHPSPSAATVAVRLAAHAHPNVRSTAALALGAQEVDDLVEALSAPDPSAGDAIAATCAARFYEPEVRTLAARLAPNLNEPARATLAPALDDVPPPIASFVEHERETPDDVRARALEIAAALARPTRDRTDELNAAISSLPAGAHRSLLAAMARRRLRSFLEPALALAAGDDEAAWFYTYAMWDGKPHTLRPLVTQFGTAALAPLLSLWRSGRALDDEARSWLVTMVARLDTRAALTLAPDAARSAYAGTREAARALLTKALHDEGEPRTEAIGVLRAALADKASQAVALDVLATAAAPELLGDLEALAAAPRGSKTLRTRLEGVLRLARFYGLKPVTPRRGGAPRDVGAHDAGLVGPVRKIALRGPFVAASSAGALVVATRDSFERRGRVEGLASDSTPWDVSSDTTWAVVLSDDGLALYDARGRPRTPKEDGEEVTHLYPNDGLGGAIALGPDRLLAWAVGHNVYNPLTVYAMPEGRKLADPKIDGFAYAVAAVEGGEAFVLLRGDGTIERRDARAGKRLSKIARVPLDDDAAWPELAVAGDGALVAVAIAPRLHVFVRLESGTYREAVTLPEAFAAGSRLVTSADTPHLALARGGEIAVFDETGMPRVTIAPATPPDAIAFAGGELIVASGRTVEAIDLASLSVREAWRAPDDIVALAGDARGWVAGLADGTLAGQAIDGGSRAR